jgi:hypothetical protein
VLAGRNSVLRGFPKVRALPVIYRGLGLSCLVSPSSPWERCFRTRWPERCMSLLGRDKWLTEEMGGHCQTWEGGWDSQGGEVTSEKSFCIILAFTRGAFCLGMRSRLCSPGFPWSLVATRKELWSSGKDLSSSCLI